MFARLHRPMFKPCAACLVVCAGATLLAATVGPAVAEQPPRSTKNRTAHVRLIEDATDESAAGVACFRVETPAATWLLEKTGAGLSSLIDPDGHDWLSFHPKVGSGAGGEYRGFPNAVHRQAGSYFHPRNQSTDPSVTKVVHRGPQRVTIAAESSNGLWACRYDFYATHCRYIMTKLPAGMKYWVLYEGTPGGRYDDSDWWMTSAVMQKTSLTQPHRGDIPAPEWIAFGDRHSHRSLVLLHHEDDSYPDDFYQMQQKMTVFGFGRARLNKYLDSMPQHFSIGFVNSTSHARIQDEILSWPGTSDIRDQ